MGTRKNLKPVLAFIDVLRTHIPKIRRAAKEDNADRLEYYRKETANYFAQAEAALAELHGQASVREAQALYESAKSDVLSSFPPL